MTEHLAQIDRLAEANMRNWMLGEQVQQRLKEEAKAKRVGPYLVISRETGANGSEIAKLVSEQLGWELLDRQILDRMAEKYGGDPALLEFVDEHTVDWLNDFVTSMIVGSDVTQSSYIHRLGKILLLAAHQGDVVIVGRGAQYFLPRKYGISVRLIAPLEYRIEQVVQLQDINRDQAIKFIENSDRDRNKFMKTYFHDAVADPSVYDLVINVEKLSIANVVELIISTIQTWLKNSERHAI